MRESRSAAPSNQEWLEQKERSNAFWLKLIIWIALTLGRPVSRAFLYPITLYFVLFSVRARQASANYLSKVLTGKVTWRHIYRHYYTFACVILDRVFFLTGKTDKFDVSVVGLDLFYDLIKQGRGIILMGAHFGSFDAMRAVGEEKLQRRVNILLYEENSRTLTSVLDALNPDLAEAVIPLGKPDAILKVRERLTNGELVGLLGDRIVQGEKVMELDFLGGKAAFPWGPLHLADVTKAPVLLCYGIYLGKNKYEMRLELLADTITIHREQRDHQMRSHLEKYVSSLESLAKEHPYNWFNFYDFWTQ